jgi:effector-binding domain-containing protein
MQLTEKPEILNLPLQHYVYVEKIGPFQETARAAWGEAHSMLKSMSSDLKKIGAMALFRMQPQMVYRAGFIFETKPQMMPDGVHYLNLDSGKYSKFTLTGSYMNLPGAWGRTMELVANLGIQTRDGFYIENYVNDPATTPEDKLISELMIPTK